MLTIDAVRTALAAVDPFEAMDRLVRAELSGGRTTADIYAALWPVVKQLRESGGLTANDREALTGTLDALTGDCDPDQCYQDPPAECAVAFADAASEARGLSFLASRFAGRVRSNGRHVMPREAVVALLDQHIPFTFVGTAEGG